ncbi:hypothetical protein IW262DRAFT_1302864 [Armillaria fumosa]|nr:hypothetical protein IW262DRAFT_1302864 [Armillaria fumosa]
MALDYRIIGTICDGMVLLQVHNLEQNVPMTQITSHLVVESHMLLPESYCVHFAMPTTGHIFSTYATLQFNFIHLVYSTSWLLPVIFEYLLERWERWHGPVTPRSRALFPYICDYHYRFLIPSLGPSDTLRGFYEVMQDTGGVTRDNAASVRRFADIIEDMYMGGFMKEVEDYISRSRHLLDHLSSHVNHVKHLFEGVDRLRMTV